VTSDEKVRHGAKQRNNTQHATQKAKHRKPYQYMEIDMSRLLLVESIERCCF
jgi:hypothetical protein